MGAQDALNALNNSKLLLGVAILLSNVGGRYIPMELSRAEEKVLQSPWARRAVVFFVVFMATRDVLIAVITTLLFILLTKRNRLLETRNKK